MTTGIGDLEHLDPLLAAFAAAGGRPNAALDRELDDWAGAADSARVLIGPAASGRAEALCRFALRRRALGEAVILLHAGLAAPAAETPRVLWCLLQQLRAVAGIGQSPPQDEASMREALPNWLARAAALAPTWLLIADADALAALDGRIDWLPAYRPPHLRLLFSAAPGACVADLGETGFASTYVDAIEPALASRATDAALAAAEAYSGAAALAAVGGLLALAREPINQPHLVAVSGLAPETVAGAITALGALLLATDDQRFAPAHPSVRLALLRRYLPDEGPRQRGFEALGAQAAPLAAPAYYRQARRPDLQLDALLDPEAIRAARSAFGRVQWLAEWRALETGAVVPALAEAIAAAASSDAALLLAAADLADTAGESAPAEWLTQAAGSASASGEPGLEAAARRGQAQAAIGAGDWPAAAGHGQASLECARRAEDVEAEAGAQHELARAAEGSGDLERARLWYQAVVDDTQARYGENHPAELPVLGNLIGVLRAAQQLDAVQPLAARAARIARSRCGPNHPATAAACDQLAAILYAGGDYAGAEAGYQEALAAAEAAFGPAHTASAAALHNLGTTLDARRNFAAAEDCYRAALAIREAAHGREHADTAATLHNLAATLDTVGRAEEAENIYRETVDIWERLYGAEHAATVTSLTNLAAVLGARGAYADAEACYRAAVEGWRRLVGDAHPNTLTTLAELGGLYAEGGKPELAEPLLEHVVETSREVLGVTDAHHINSVCALAALWRDSGRAREAEVLLSETLVGVEAGLGLLAPAVQQLRRQLDTLRGDVLH